MSPQSSSQNTFGLFSSPQTIVQSTLSNELPSPSCALIPESEWNLNSFSFDIDSLASRSLALDRIYDLIPEGNEKTESLIVEVAKTTHSRKICPSRSKLEMELHRLGLCASSPTGSRRGRSAHSGLGNNSSAA
ncbi:unnamed protein product [Linum trigynum]